MNQKTYHQARLQVVGYRGIQIHVNASLEAYGINTSQWIILGWLYDTRQGMRVSALATLLKVEKPLITTLIQPLEEQGLITMTVDEKDKRAKQLTLTRKGLTLVPKIEKKLSQDLAVFERDVSPEMMKNYFLALEKFIENADIN